MNQGQTEEGVKKVVKSCKKQQSRVPYALGNLSQLIFNLKLIKCFVAYLFCEMILIAGSLCINALISKLSLDDGFTTYGIDWIRWIRLIHLCLKCKFYKKTTILYPQLE